MEILPTCLVPTNYCNSAVLSQQGDIPSTGHNPMSLYLMSTPNVAHLPLSDSVIPRFTKPEAPISPSNVTLRSLDCQETKARGYILLPLQGWIVHKQNNTYCFSEKKSGFT